MGSGASAKVNLVYDKDLNQFLVIKSFTDINKYKREVNNYKLIEDKGLTHLFTKGITFDYRQQNIFIEAGAINLR